MVRLSFDDQLLAEDDFAQLRPKRRKRRRWGARRRAKSCCCFPLVFLLILFGILVTAIIAKTGIVEIPFFSSIFYELPQASRLIEIDPADLAGSLSAKLNQGSVVIEITEQELTYLVRQQLSGKKDSPFAESVQALINGKTVEFFGLLLKPVAANITLILEPLLIDHQLVLRPIEVKIGNLALPPSLSQWLFDRFFAARLGEFNKLLLKFGQLEHLELESGKLIITSQPDF